MSAPAILLLENEEPFHGDAMGHEGVATGVMALSALTSGFSDLLTDPVYGGKMVCFTYPHVGNTGVVPADMQSGAVAARAVIAREFSRIKANRLGVETFDGFLKKNGIPAIEGIDTRTVAEIVARRGRVRAVLGCGRFADAGALAREFGRDQSAWTAGNAGAAEPYEWSDASVAVRRLRVLVYDLGVKKGFLRRLAGMGCVVKVVPASQAAEETLAEKPDGVVFSAGPGLPEHYPAAGAAAAKLIGKTPLWGVGVGAGLMAHAAGATLVVNGRSHLGHQPVGRPGGPSGEITMQCHEFWIEGESLAGAGLTPTHVNLNDGTLEGFRCERRSVMGVLFHPEGEPGPHDSLYLFDRFHAMMLRKEGSNA